MQNTLTQQHWPLIFYLLPTHDTLTPIQIGQPLSSIVEVKLLVEVWAVNDKFGLRFHAREKDSQITARLFFLLATRYMKKPTSAAGGSAVMS